MPADSHTEAAAWRARRKASLIYMARHPKEAAANLAALVHWHNTLVERLPLAELFFQANREGEGLYAEARVGALLRWCGPGVEHLPPAPALDSKMMELGEAARKLCIECMNTVPEHFSRAAVGMMPVAPAMDDDMAEETASACILKGHAACDGFVAVKRVEVADNKVLSLAAVYLGYFSAVMTASAESENIWGFAKLGGAWQAADEFFDGCLVIMRAKLERAPGGFSELYEPCLIP